MLKTIHIIGLGLGPNDIGPAAQRLIDVSDILAGEERLVNLFPDHLGQKLVLDNDLEAWLDGITRLAHSYRVVVVSPGDPNQFDLAERIVARAGPENVRIHPNVSIFQAAFARLKEPWDGVPVVSFDTQGEESLFSAVRTHSRVAVFTNETFPPARVARMLLDRGQTGWRMCVLENLESPDYRVSFHRLWEASERSFSSRNLVVLWQKEEVTPLTLGTSRDILEGEGPPLTSVEARAVALTMLRLKPDMTLWALGNDSGALGLEATLFLPKGRVYTVEPSTDRIKFIEANRTKFGVANLVLIHDQLPQALGPLPDPDRIFIGILNVPFKEILDTCAWRLKAGGVILVAVTDRADLESVRSEMNDLDLTPEVLQIQITRNKDVDGASTETIDIPVWLIFGRNT